MKKWVLLAISICVVFALSLSTASAATPYQAYNYSDSEGYIKAVPAPIPYKVSRIIDSNVLGVALQDPQDLAKDSKGNFYIVDKKANAIICLNENWQVQRIISEFDNHGMKDTFNGPEGIYVTPDGKFYIADTENGRIVILSEDGSLLGMIEKPESDILAEGFVFFPRKLTVDNSGRIFVVARGVFEGMMEFYADGRFQGFVGSMPVQVNPIDLIWKSIFTKEQRDRMVQFIPVTFENLYLDQKGFIFAVSSSQNTTPLMRLNPSGKDVLIRNKNSLVTVTGDIMYPDYGSSAIGPSVFVDVCVDEHGIYSVLDSKRGRIFSYDSDSNLLFAFGGINTEQVGTFKKPVAIETHNDQLMVLDAGLASVTVFEKTEYGRLVQEGILTYQNGEYDESVKIWKEVLKYNMNFDLAYAKIGRVYFRQEKYKEAMHFFKLGHDVINYSKAYFENRKDFLRVYLGIGLSIILLIVILRKILKFIFRRWPFHGPVLLSSIGQNFMEDIKFAFHIIIHPIDGFWDMKYEKRGRMSVSLGIVAMVILTVIFERLVTSLIFNPNYYRPLDMFREIRNVLLPFVLFCVANWSVTTLVDGEGSPRDILMATGYSLLPFVLIRIPLAIVSNFLTLEENAFYRFFIQVSLIWVVMLLFLGMMTIHRFTVAKTFSTAIVNIASMGVIVFIGMLFFSLLTEIAGFAYSVYKEVMLRL